MDVLERISRGYRAIGPGAPRDVLAMFHQDQPDPPEWVVDDSLRVVPTRDVVAMDLFAGALPSHWEIIGVDLRHWDYYAGKARLVVTGRFRTRPRGTWEVIKLPFIHIWSWARTTRFAACSIISPASRSGAARTCGRGADGASGAAPGSRTEPPPGSSA